MLSDYLIEVKGILSSKKSGRYFYLLKPKLNLFGLFANFSYGNIFSFPLYYFDTSAISELLLCWLADKTSRRNFCRYQCYPYTMASCWYSAFWISVLCLYLLVCYMPVVGLYRSGPALIPVYITISFRIVPRSA